MHLFRPAPAALQPGPQSSETVFLSVQHRMVLADLSRVLAGPPCLSALTGEAGLGKSVLANAAVAGWAGPVRVVRGDAPAARAILAEFGGSAGAQAEILIVEDAHKLTAATLEELGRDRVAAGGHVVLVGRPELWARLRESPPVGKVDERIGTRMVLFPMSFSDSEAYLHHLFRRAGGSVDGVLTEEAQRGVLRRGRGNMRAINAALAAVLPGSTLPGSSWPEPTAGTPSAAAEPAARRPSMAHRLGPAVAQAAAIVATLGGIAAGLLLLVEPGTVHAPLETPAPERQAAVPAPVQPRLPDGPERSGTVVEPSAPLPAPAVVLGDEVVAGLVRRGDALLGLHDISGARRYFERAALEGGGPLRARAAAALAASYDGAAAASEGWDVNPELALAWYRLAASLGDMAAPAAIDRLGRGRPEGGAK